MPEPKRQSLLSGTWDSTGMLLANAAKAAETAKRLPYLGVVKPALKDRKAGGITLPPFFIGSFLRFPERM
jgi:hypothetical protein